MLFVQHDAVLIMLLPTFIMLSCYLMLQSAKCVQKWFNTANEIETRKQEVGIHEISDSWDSRRKKHINIVWEVSHKSMVAPFSDRSGSGHDFGSIGNNFGSHLGTTIYDTKRSEKRSTTTTTTTTLQMA